MSVLIKDMDMPKEGVYNAVITFDGDSISVRIPPSKKPFFSGKIVHVPTPHGRLIDADELIGYLNEWLSDSVALFGFTRIINHQPTFIEAEVKKCQT